MNPKVNRSESDYYYDNTLHAKKVNGTCGKVGIHKILEV